MKTCIKEIIVDKINKSEWWHVPPQDSKAYSKRGKFLASTYQQAEFYGRPSYTPERIFVSNPIYGFSERDILIQLFPDGHNVQLLDQLESEESQYQDRIDLDAKMSERAKFLGYDAIVLMTPAGEKELKRNRKPRSIELNLLNV